MTPQELLSALPKKVKVGTLSYTLEVVPDLKDEGHGINGMCVPDELKIMVDAASPSNAHAVDTVVHEIFHAIWDERGLPKKPDEERAVRCLSTGVVALFQDNPKLVNWIKKGLR